MRRWLILFIVLGLPPANALPAAVQRSIGELRDNCRERGAAPASPRRGFIRRIDFNRDGRMDFILDTSRFACVPFANFSCGSAGCRIDVFVSTPRGHANFLGHTVHAVRLFTWRRETVMLVEFHGDICRAGWRSAMRSTAGLAWWRFLYVERRQYGLSAGQGAGISRMRAGATMNRLAPLSPAGAAPLPRNPTMPGIAAR